MKMTTDTESTRRLSKKSQFSAKNTFPPLQSRPHLVSYVDTAVRAYPETGLSHTITNATVEMHYLPTNCAHVPYMVSVNVQLASMNVNRHNVLFSIFCRVGFNDTPQFCTEFYVRHYFARLLSVKTQNVMSYWWECQQLHRPL